MAQWYRQAVSKGLNKEWDWDSDTIVLSLHNSTYTPNLDTHAYVSDLTNELSTASGYTAGGLTLTSCTRTYTAANSWATQRANSTAYVVGDVIRPASGNGFLYLCVVAGTSAGTTTTLGTVVGRETTDGTAVFENIGAGITTLSAATATWSSFSAGPFRYGVISDRTPGTAATQPLLGLIDFGSNQTGGGASYNVAFTNNGPLHVFAK
ncbi:hypothetical protein ACIOD2_32385 [Amycolatopsis sp. NPDC088138]|uniref:hypothetical protein n=1 Tax=Amycolatopsis sp. NPDC088138 TaxID=3363938 RepID=UPI0038078248